MDPEQKNILKAKSELISNSVSLEKIKPLLLDFKIFNRYMWNDINSVSDVCDLLPSRGPKAFENFIHILRKSKYEKEAEYLENPSCFMKLPYKLFYQMSSTPLGYCLIINNVKFDNLEERWGSDKDAESLKMFFEKIGYVVIVVRNKQAAEMYSHIEKFSQSNLQNVDSCVVIILSHGTQVHNQDVICGTDGECIFKSDIINFFSNTKCVQLQGKPKIFFFIACRGDNKDYGAPNLIPSERIDTMEIKGVLPTLTDILVVHSSLPNHISMRDHVKGSWFCQDLISVLQDYHTLYDLETIIKIANNKLVKRISTYHRVTQVAHTENFGVNKQLMLCRNPN